MGSCGVRTEWFGPLKPEEGDVSVPVAREEEVPKLGPTLLAYLQEMLYGDSVSVLPGQVAHTSRKSSTIYRSGDPYWLEMYECHSLHIDGENVCVGFELKRELLDVMDPISLDEAGFYVDLSKKVFSVLGRMDERLRHDEAGRKVYDVTAALSTARDALTDAGLDVDGFDREVSESESLWMVRFGVLEEQAEKVFKKRGYSRVIVVISKRTLEYRIFRSKYPM